MTHTIDHYEVLGVARDASEREIKRAFYSLLKEHPPEQKPKEYQLLREAYDILSNPVSRKEYDSMAVYGQEIETLRIEAEEILNEEEPDYQKAIRLLKKAMVLGPEIGLLRNMLGSCYLEVDEPQEAMKQLIKATQIDPENLTYQLNKGHVYEKLGKTQLAEAQYRQVWDRDKEDYAAPRALASLLFEAERTDEALRVLEEAIGADGKLDFQDFFCYYDKLHFLLFSRRHDELGRELARVVEIARRPEEREFAAFMLARMGAQLFDLKVFALAKRFTDAAENLNPNNEALATFASTARKLGTFEESVERIQKSSEYHDIVKYMVGIHAAAYVEDGNEDDLERQHSELLKALDNIIQIDPESSKIKQSLRKIKREHPAVYEIQSELYELILGLPAAHLISKPCPHCREEVINEKSNTGYGSCPHCHRTIYFDGKSYMKEGPSEGGNGYSSYSPSNYSSGNVSTNSGGGGCFVATAVYGDPHHSDVQLLRLFRDRTLVQYAAGRAFIRFYYKYGPRAADFVRPKPVLRVFIRRALELFTRLI